MIYLAVLLGFLLAFYIAVLSWLGIGFRKLRRRSDRGSIPSTTNALPAVSVIVAARNEEANLHRLLDSLRQQDYPSDKLEFIVVDDRSGDQTPDILEGTRRGWNSLHVIRIDDMVEGFAPKKRALDTAIRAARGDILLLTDADCSPPPSWVRTMVSYFTDRTAMVIGFSSYRFDTAIPPVLKGMLELDYFSTVTAIAAAGAGAGLPLSATGTNLAYRKSAYHAVGGFGGFRHWISGDDDLLMHQMRREKAGEIGFALSSGAAVPAAAPKSLRQFWNQRIRFASKGLIYDWPITAGLTLVYLLNALLVIGAFLSPFSESSVALMTLCVWGGKSLAELGFLLPVAMALRVTRLLRFFLPTALLHPFYVAMFGLLGTVGGFEWKGSTSSQSQALTSSSADRRR